jgi:hypothetical protein
MQLVCQLHDVYASCIMIVFFASPGAQTVCDLLLCCGCILVSRFQPVAQHLPGVIPTGVSSVYLAYARIAVLRTQYEPCRTHVGQPTVAHRGQVQKYMQCCEAKLLMQTL